MGNLISSSSEIKSNLFSCACTDDNKFVSPSSLGEIKVDQNDSTSVNYMNTIYKNFADNIPEVNNDMNEYLKVHSYRTQNKLKSKSKMTIVENNTLFFIEIDIEKFDESQLRNNHLIDELNKLIDHKPFELSNKEDYEIKSKQNNPNLSLKVLKYTDNSIYKGFVNKQNMKECFGTYYLKDGSIYEGFFLNDNFNGHGRLYRINNYVYDGEFENNLFNGFGKLRTINGLTYEGLWKADKQEGYGIETYEDGSVYKGTYLNGLKNGKGKFIWKNGTVFEGNFVNDEIFGWGMCKWPDGRGYNGQWEKLKMDGVGVFVWSNGNYYIGQYKNGEKEGYGVFYSSSNTTVEGFWKNGKQHGYCITTNQYNNKYYALYENGKKKSINILKMDFQDSIDNKFKEKRKEINFSYLLELKSTLIINKINQNQSLNTSKIYQKQISKISNNTTQKQRKRSPIFKFNQRYRYKSLISISTDFYRNKRNQICSSNIITSRKSKSLPKKSYKFINNILNIEHLSSDYMSNFMNNLSLISMQRYKLSTISSNINNINLFNNDNTMKANQNKSKIQTEKINKISTKTSSELSNYLRFRKNNNE